MPFVVVTAADGAAPAVVTTPHVGASRRLTASMQSIGPVIRSMRWWPLVGSTGATLVLLWLLRPDGPDTTGAIGGLRVGAYLLAVTAALGLDDGAEATVAASPTPLLLRRTVRLAVGLVPTAAAWCAAAAIASALQVGGAPAPPLGALTVEAAAMVGFALAVAAVVSARAGDGVGGVAALPALTLLIVALLIVQARWPQHLVMFPMDPGDPSWTVAHQRWGALAAIGLGAVVTSSLDPGRRRHHLTRPRRRLAVPVPPT